MKILRVSQHLYPEVTGGMPYHVHAMSRNQAKLGHDVTVITTRNDPALPSDEIRQGYRIRRFDPTISAVGNDISIDMARFLLRDCDADVIHAHSHLHFSSNLAAIRRRLGQTPLAITNHGLFSQTVSKSVQEFYLRTVGKWTFNASDLIFCYSTGVKQRFRDRGIDVPIEVIPNGIDPKYFTPHGEKTCRIDNAGPVILSVVRLVPGKRPIDLIQAMSHVIDLFPDAHLYFVGEGYHRNELEEYVLKEDLERHVTFLGELSYELMPQVYRSCDVLVLPSEEEAGAPRVVLEAMACRKPCVITEMDHTIDVLLNSNVTVPVGDTEALADSLVMLVEDLDRCEEMGRLGRELVKQRFSWEETVQLTTKSLVRLSGEVGSDD